MPAMTSGIYKIFNVHTGKCYIGSAINIDSRRREHYDRLASRRHENSKLQNAWNKYGEIKFQFEILEEVEDKFALIAREQYWIDVTNAVKDGYNICPIAGNTLGVKHSQATKDKIREKAIGRKMSSASRQKMSETRKGRPSPLRGRKQPNISNALKGRPSPMRGKKKPASSFAQRKISDDTIRQVHLLRYEGKTHKEIMSTVGISLRSVARILNNRGVYGLLAVKFEITPELTEMLHKTNIARLSLSQTGKSLSEETKKKISVSRTGKLCGQEHPMFGKSRPDVSERNKAARKLSNAQAEQAHGHRRAGMTLKAIAAIYGVSPSLIYRQLKNFSVTE